MTETAGHFRLSKLVRLYIISAAGKATYIAIYTDTEFTENDYIAAWQNRLRESPATIRALTGGQYRVPSRNCTGANATWHTGTVLFQDDFTASVREAMQKAVRYMPDGSDYGLVFLNTGTWNGVQHDAASAIINERRVKAGCLSDPEPEPAPVETPLMRWYNARKAYKEAEEDLLTKLNSALVEKAKDPALNPVATNFGPVTAVTLDRIATFVDAPVCDCHPARVAAYETVGCKFGPLIERATCSLSDFQPSGIIKTACVTRCVYFPWHEQK